MYYAYVLQSEKDGTHYYGHAESVEVRLTAHNAGRSKSTKGRRPWKVIYQEAFESRAEAYRRELFFKSIEGYRFLKANRIT